MNNTQITPELYEQVKAMVLEEIKANNRAKAKAREAERIAAHKRECEAKAKEEAEINNIVDPFRFKYTPLLAKRYERTFVSGTRSLYDVISIKLNEAVNTALQTIGIHSVVGAYRLGKLEEVIQMSGAILDAIISGGNPER